MDLELIKQELAVPIRSFRLFALEQIIQEGDSFEIIEFLHQYRASEDDAECLVLVDHATRVVSHRVTESMTSPQLTAEEFRQQLEGGTDQEGLFLLSRLSRAQKETFREPAMEVLEKTDSLFLKAGIIREFKAVFPREELKRISPLLFSPHLSLRTAVMEVLVLKAPELLQRDLPKFLLHEDPRIRTLAIMGLAGIDQEEALHHLAHLLENGTPEQILAALKSSVFFPFNLIKPLLLKTLSLVQDAGLIKRIGMFLENNPDPEVPFRIWELVENAVGDRQTALQTILRNTCENTEKSGILGNDFPAYQERLKQWIQHRRIISWTRGLVAALEENPENLEELETVVREKLSSPQTREIMQEALQWPLSEMVKKILQSWMNEEPCAGTQTEATSKPIPKSAPIDAVSDFSTLTPEERIKEVARWRTLNPKLIHPLLHKIFQAKEVSPDLAGTALRTANSLGLSDFQEQARLGLKSRDPNWLQAAIEYLGENDSDWFFSYLGKLLNHPSLRVRGAAVRVLQKHDPARGISCLQAMLHAQNRDSIQTAIGCLVHFDFLSIRTLLLAFMNKASDNRQFYSALFFFEANPDSGNIYELFRLEKCLETSGEKERAQGVRSVRKKNFDILEQTRQNSAPSWEASEKACEAQWSQDQERSAPAPYSVRVLIPPGKSKAGTYSGIVQWFADLGGRTVELYSLRPRIFVGTIGLILLFILFTLYSSTRAPKQQAPGKALPAKPATLYGQVQEVRVTGMSFIADDGRFFLLHPPAGAQFSPMKAGSRVRITCVPFRVMDDGKIKAQCLAIREFRDKGKKEP